MQLVLEFSSADIAILEPVHRLERALERAELPDKEISQLGFFKLLVLALQAQVHQNARRRLRYPSVHRTRSGSRAVSRAHHAYTVRDGQLQPARARAAAADSRFGFFVSVHLQ